VGEELASMLGQRDGFCAYESALLVHPVRRNAPKLWKEKYVTDHDNVLFFAEEDAFGCQFCLHNEKVWTFDPETGALEEMSPSLGLWARSVTEDCEYRTGFPLAHAWQLQNGPLLNGTRLLPKVPFVLGGKFEMENLYQDEDVKGMLFRASIANQIRDVPDGSEISLSVERSEQGKEKIAMLQRDEPESTDGVRHRPEKDS
jgi:hypothetical protein